MRYVLHGKEKKDIVNNQITPPLGLSGPLFLTYFYGTGDGAGDIGMGEVGICTLTCLARGGRTVELQWCWIAERVVGSCLTLNCAQGANGHAPNPHPGKTFSVRNSRLASLGWSLSFQRRRKSL